MKLTLNYQKGVLNIPAAATEFASRATKKDLCVLMAVATVPGCAEDFGASAAEVARLAGVTKEELFASMAFWRGAGVYIMDEDSAEEMSSAALASETGKVSDPVVGSGAECGTETEKKEEKKKKLLKREMPTLTADDIKKITSEAPERLALIDACQNMIGKMFSTAECAVLLGLREFLGVEDEYIIMAAAYCAKKGKKAIKYLEKTVLSLYDEKDIETVEQLEDYIRRLEAWDDMEFKIRRLIGAGERKFTKQEQVFINQWANEYSFGFEMIEFAYEKTVGAIGKPSMPYMHKILASWHEKGYKTPDDIASREKGASMNKNSGSFDTDEFFNLAVKRGLELNNSETNNG